MEPTAIPSTTPSTPTIDPRTRNLAIALGVAALLVMIGIFTKSWFTAPRGEGGVGLTGIEMCRGDTCRSVSWDELKRAPDDIGIFGTLGLLGGLASVGFTAAAIVLALQGKAHKLPLKIMNGVLGLTAFFNTFFFMRVWGEMGKDVDLGYSGFLAIGGLIAIGLVVRQLLLTLKPVMQR
jgi:hypothetical protein